MKVLITGISGFSGRNLLDYLLLLNDVNFEIMGISRANIDNQKVKYLSICQIDLMDYPQLFELVNNFKPEIVIHLAGKNKGDTPTLFESNVICTRNLLEAILETGINPNIMITGSSSQYGFAGFDPISEGTSFAPQSEYGATKCLQEKTAQYYFKRFGLNIVFTRTFNLIGPYQPKNLFIGSIIDQLVNIKKGISTDIIVFHMNSSRDYIDVRDAVKAYWMLVSSKNFIPGMKGEIFNVGSGISYTLSEILTIILNIADLHPQIQITNPNFQDVISTQIASIKKISELISWNPEYSLNQSIMYIIEDSKII